jgi:hypothetical protein
MRKNDLDKRENHLNAQTRQLFHLDPIQFGKNGGRLSPEGEPIITYFDLQKYLPQHCGKRIGEVPKDTLPPSTTVGTVVPLNPKEDCVPPQPTTI